MEFAGWRLLMRLCRHNVRDTAAPPGGSLVYPDAMMMIQLHFCLVRSPLNHSLDTWATREFILAMAHVLLGTRTQTNTRDQGGKRALHETES